MFLFDRNRLSSLSTRLLRIHSHTRVQHREPPVNSATQGPGFRVPLVTMWVALLGGYEEQLPLALFVRFRFLFLDLFLFLFVAIRVPAELHPFLVFGHVCLLRSHTNVPFALLFLLSPILSTLKSISLTPLSKTHAELCYLLPLCLLFASLQPSWQTVAARARWGGRLFLCIIMAT